MLTTQPSVSAAKPSANREATEQVAVLICTYQRPQGFKRLIDSFRALDIPDHMAPIFCIADNNPESQRLGYIAQAMHDFPWEWHYKHVDQRGFSSARNASLELALEHTQAPYFCITDDDEVVPRRWLIDLVSGIETFNCDVVTGAYGHLSRPRIAGRRLNSATTGNVCFKRWLVAPQGLSLRFLLSLDEQGGEDRDFFGRALQFGAEIRALRSAHIMPHELALNGSIWHVLAAQRSRSTAIASIKRNQAAHSLNAGETWTLLKLLARSFLQLGKAIILAVVGLVSLAFSSKRARLILASGEKSWLRFLAPWQGALFGPIARQDLRSGDNYP